MEAGFAVFAGIPHHQIRIDAREENLQSSTRVTLRFDRLETGAALSFGGGVGAGTLMRPVNAHRSRPHKDAPTK